MRKLFFYILRQITGPFLLFTLILTLVVWMTQSLRMLDLVINRGQSAGIFLYLTMLILPSLLVVIAPIAFFGAALYAAKLSGDPLDPSALARLAPRPGDEAEGPFP